MNTKLKVTTCLLLFSAVITAQQPEKKKYTIQTIAFYNLENLFDIHDDPKTFDDDKTAEGKDHWTQEKYVHKLKNLGRVISEIGLSTTKSSPAILGVAEIENQKVLEDLINTSYLQSKNYGIIHFDSPDRRGIDVALLYKKRVFIPKDTRVHELLLYDNQTHKRIYTRDQLVVSGYLDGELIHILVNHWPSRRGGTSKSRYKREQAAVLSRKIMDSLFAINPYSKIVMMGDLNDTPRDPSIIKTLGAKSYKEDTKLKGLYNPMIQMSKKGIGSIAWGDQWSLFDQIMVSTALVQPEYSSYQYYKAGIFNPRYLTTSSGKYKGYPFRSFSNGQYTEGYSDHFPVYIYLIKEKKK